MNLCAFCGSSEGLLPVFSVNARLLGLHLGSMGDTLIYGGGNVGLMGILADSTLENGGKVIGVIPDFLLQREVGHRGLTQLEVVRTMHERKKRMADLAHAFIALPGGWGTLDELAEILTWKQLGLINQPVGVLNTQNFFDPLLSQMHHMASMGFLRKDNLDFLTIDNDPEKLLMKLKKLT